MEACIICSEKERMERLEAKIDKLCDAITDIKVSLGRLDGTREKIETHEKEINDLKSKTKIYDALATRRSVMLAHSLAIAALIVSALPWVYKLFDKSH